MNNEFAVEDKKSSNTTRLKWVGFILMCTGILSFSNKEMLGDIITLSGAILFLGSCFWSIYKKRFQN
ncbi:MAG: hypothetical protein ABJI69_08135 [Balneola sp.]